MSFKDIADLDCSVTYALGGTDKKSGKKNPTTLEGFYIGTRQVASPKSKTGFAALHVFQTKTGNVGVWGKTNLDQKMTAVKGGQLTKVTFTGMIETKNNPMYAYRVQVDPEQTIEVNISAAATADAGGNEGAYDDNNSSDYAPAAAAEGEYEQEADLGEEETPLDEVPVSRAAAPARRIATPDPARAARVQALLNGRGAKRA